MSGSGGNYTTTLTLEAGTSYTFLFWADDKSYTYDTTNGLTAVSAGTDAGVAYATTATWNGTDATVTASLKLVVSKVTLQTTTALTAGQTVGLEVPSTYGGYNVQTGAYTGSATAHTYTYTVPTGGLAAGSEVCSFYVLTDSSTEQDLTLTCGSGSTTVNDVTLGPGQHLTISGDIAELAQSSVNISVGISDDWTDSNRGFGSVDTYTDDTQASTSLTGSGMADDPYLITSVADFMYLLTLGNDNTGSKGKYYRLTTDLDIQTTTWNSGNSQFAGLLNGDGHTISGTLNITPGAYNGLFGRINNNGSISNLNVTADINMSGASDERTLYVGGIVGGCRSGSISHCTYSGTITLSTTGTASGIHIGGICGFGGDANISHCTNSGTVTVENCTNNGGSLDIYAGGILGSGTNSTISQCTHSGTVTEENNTVGGDKHVGGILGHNWSGSTLTDNDCSQGKPSTPVGDE